MWNFRRMKKIEKKEKKHRKIRERNKSKRGLQEVPPETAQKMFLFETNASRNRAAIEAEKREKMEKSEKMKNDEIL